MNSRPIGYMKLEEERLQPELKSIIEGPWCEAYTEYAVGDWSTMALWNRSGKSDDGYSYEYDGSPRTTAFGKTLTYLNSRIKETFETAYMKSVRVFRARRGGFIIPHIDYMEFKEGFNRVHVPLQTSKGCLNSEDDFVYHMRQSEIWWLDGRRPHSGGCFSKADRLHLVIDFDPKANLAELITAEEARRPRDFILIKRPELESGQRLALLELGEILTPLNFDDVLGLLGKIHFERKVNAAAMYAWLCEIAERSGDSVLLSQAQEARLKFVGSFDLEEERLAEASTDIPGLIPASALAPESSQVMPAKSGS